MKVLRFIGSFIFWTLLFVVATLFLGPVGFLGALIMFGFVRFIKWEWKKRDEDHAKFSGAES